MVYYGRRYTTRRRARRTLSNYRIATRTSAKAQSRQIYALKKRVNKIQRLTKPEIVTIQRNSSAIDLLSGQGPVNWITTGTTLIGVIQPNLGSIVSNTAGSITSNVPNNFARLNSLRIYGNMQYTSITNTSVPVNLRIVVVQQKASRQSALTFNDVFTSGTSGNDNFSAVFGPLQIGLARTCKVLSDKRYCLSYQRPSINIRTNLKYLMNFYRDSNSNDSGTESSEAYYKGSIYLYYAIYSQATESIGSLNLMYKLAYTDA